MSVAFADYDGDGFMDVFVTNDAVPEFLFHNRATERSRRSGCWPACRARRTGGRCPSMGIDFRDYDNDGRPDIVLTALTGETFPLFKNDKAGILPRRDVRERPGQEHGSDERMGRDVSRTSTTTASRI